MLARSGIVMTPANGGLNKLHVDPFDDERLLILRVPKHDADSAGHLVKVEAHLQQLARRV